MNVALMPTCYQFARLFQKRFFATKKSKKDDYLIVRAKARDACEINHFLHQYYYPDEPTFAAAGLGWRVNPVIDEMVLNAISEGYSFLAKCRYDNSLVGAAINCSVCPWDADRMEKLACSIQCPATAQLLQFYAHVMRAPELWHKCHVNKLFEIAMLSVRPAERGNGLATKLTRQSANFAKDLGYQVVKIVATSNYTARLCEKLKFKMAYQLPYCAYVDANNIPIYQPPPPHSAIQVFVQFPQRSRKKL